MGGQFLFAKCKGAQGFELSGTFSQINKDGFPFEPGDVFRNPELANTFKSIAANAPLPHRRPVSSMGPLIMFKGNEPVLVLGSPGGIRIFPSLTQIIINIFDFGMNLDEAIEAPPFKQPVLITSAGQSAEVQLSNLEFRRVGGLRFCQGSPLGDRKRLSWSIKRKTIGLTHHRGARTLPCSSKMKLS